MNWTDGHNAAAGTRPCASRPAMAERPFIAIANGSRDLPKEFSFGGVVDFHAPHLEAGSIKRNQG
jgi:hypothetical protein